MASQHAGGEGDQHDNGQDLAQALRAAARRLAKRAIDQIAEHNEKLLRQALNDHARTLALLRRVVEAGAREAQHSKTLRDLLQVAGEHLRRAQGKLDRMKRRPTNAARDQEIVRLRDELKWTWGQIARKIGKSVDVVRQAYRRWKKRN